MSSYHLFDMTLYFRVTSWLQSENFDPCMLPMGELAYHLAIRPSSEYSIEGDGLTCRESIPLDLEVKHPFNIMDKHSQWALVYEILYLMNPVKKYNLICSVSRDPLGMLSELLLRHDDDQLDHLACLPFKYPM